MSLRTLAVLTGFGAVLASSMPAVSVAQPAPAAQVSPKSEALVRRYLDEIHFQRLMDSMLASLMPVMLDSMSKQYPSITPDQRDQIGDTVREVMTEQMMPKMIERMVPIYAATFSESELEAIVAFYGSPAGQAIIEKSPSLAPKSAEITRELLPDIQREVIRRMCAKLDCFAAKPAPPPAPKPS